VTSLFPPRITGSVQGPLFQPALFKRLGSIALFYGILGALGAIGVVVYYGVASLIGSKLSPTEPIIPLAQPMTFLLIAWGVVTVVFLALLIRRSLLTSHEDDQVFLDPAEDHMAMEKRELMERTKGLSNPLVTSGAVSAVLFLVLACIWIYKGLANL
jgi:hypothetical protein